MLTFLIGNFNLNDSKTTPSIQLSNHLSTESNMSAASTPTSSNSAVLNEFILLNPNLSNDFQVVANSPLEGINPNIFSGILDHLNSIFILSICSSYLMVMAIIIFSCKLIIDSKVNLDFIKN